MKTWQKQLRNGIIQSRLKLGVNKMKVEKIDHVSIVVKDIEKVAKFYADLFETEFTGPGEHKELDVTSLRSPIGIELVSPLTPDGATARTLERRGEGVYLISLKVANVEEASAEMKSKGIRQVAALGTGSALFHPKDLYGIMIALTES